MATESAIEGFRNDEAIGQIDLITSEEESMTASSESSEGESEPSESEGESGDERWEPYSDDSEDEYLIMLPARSLPTLPLEVQQYILKLAFQNCRTLPDCPVSLTEVKDQHIETVYSDHALTGRGRRFTTRLDRVKDHQSEVERLLEEKARIEERLAELPSKIAEAEAVVKTEADEILAYENSFEAKIKTGGLCSELWVEYEAFCESLGEGVGSIDGFSMTCNGPHHGSYVSYDPTFSMFKACEEAQKHKDWNFRCEAFEDGNEQVVEFWPMPIFQQYDEEEKTWGDLFPDLYDLALRAACQGSDTAIEILVALPSRDVSFQGGWLFEYEHVAALEYHPIIGKRWRFCLAHDINTPRTVEEKITEVEQQLVDWVLRPSPMARAHILQVQV